MNPPGSKFCGDCGYDLREPKAGSALAGNFPTTTLRFEFMPLPTSVTQKCGVGSLDIKTSKVVI